MFLYLNQGETKNLINAYKFLIELRGNNNKDEMKYIIDKRIYLTKTILSSRIGFIFFLLSIFIYRRYKLELFENKYTSSKNSKFSSVVKPDNLVPSKKVPFKILIKRILISFSLICNIRKHMNNNIIDNFLTIEFLWILSCLYSDETKFNQGEVILNADFSPKDAAILAYVNIKTKINILNPLYWKYSDDYYTKLTKFADFFLISHKFCNIKKELLNNCEVKLIKYKFKELSIKFSEIPCIGIFFSTFKNNEDKRFDIVINAIKDIFEKFGKNINLIIKPHPYELDIFLENNKLNSMNIKIAKNNDFIRKIDFCFVTQSSVIFEILLLGKPIILLKQIDPYLRFGGNPVQYEFFYSSNNVVPKFKTIKACPDFKEIVDIYSNKKNCKDISNFLIGE